VVAARRPPPSPLHPSSRRRSSSRALSSSGGVRCARDEGVGPSFVHRDVDRFDRHREVRFYRFIDISSLDVTRLHRFIDGRRTQRMRPCASTARAVHLRVRRVRRRHRVACRSQTNRATDSARD
jgi:hypothetical protein